MWTMNLETMFAKYECLEMHDQTSSFPALVSASCPRECWEVKPLLLIEHLDFKVWFTFKNLNKNNFKMVDQHKSLFNSRSGGSSHY